MTHSMDCCIDESVYTHSTQPLMVGHCYMQTSGAWCKKDQVISTDGDRQVRAAAGTFVRPLYMVSFYADGLILAGPKLYLQSPLVPHALLSLTCWNMLKGS